MQLNWKRTEASSLEQIKMTKFWLRCRNIYYITSSRVSFDRCKFLVIFTDVGHIHLVILIRSSEYSSKNHIDINK